MDILTLLACTASNDKNPDSFAQSLQAMPTEEILNVWESSQALSMALQQTFLPAARLHSATEDLIILELTRRRLRGCLQPPCSPVAEAMEGKSLADKPRASR